MIAQMTTDVRALFDEQRRRYDADPNPARRERLAWLDALGRAIRNHREALYVALAEDFGKARDEVELTEINLTLSELKYARKNLADWMRPEAVKTPLKLLGARSRIVREPKGVVLILSPWNYPIYLTLSPLIAALAAGNRAIVRVSEKVPHSRAVLASIAAEAFAPGDVAFVGGEIDVAEALLELPFDHIFFTGSTRVGKRVMRAAAEHLASVTLELGGKSPAIVTRDADVKSAAKRIAWGKFINAGQTCVAPDYVLADESVAPALIGELKAAVEHMYGAAEADRASSRDFARLVDDGSFARLSGLLDESLRSGATLAFGGERDAATRYLAPTVLSGVRPEAPIMREEIFGPILPVMTYRSLDEALAYVRAHDKPLALYAFSRSGGTVAKILRETSAGGTAIGDTAVQLTNPNLPFGGVGASGLGSYHGQAGFRAFSHERAVMSRTWLLPQLYPPYTAYTRRMLALLDRFF